MNFSFYSTLFSKLDASLDAYWSSAASGMASAIAPVATTLVTIYVILWGWSLMRGIISEPVTDGIARIIRLTIIVALAINIGIYNGYLARFLWELPDALANIVAGGHSGNNAMHFIDQLMGQFYELAQAFNDKAYADTGITGLPDLGLWLAGWAILIAGTIVTGYTAFLFTLAKMALAILLGIGPACVLMTLFEPTKRFFDMWMGQALNYVFLVLLAASAVRLIMGIIQSYMGAAIGTASGDPSVVLALPAVIFCIVGLLVMMQLPSIASALGGGVAVGTLGAVGWAYGRATGGLSSLRHTTMRRSLNRIKSDVAIAGRAAGTPLSVYRRVTGAAGKNAF